MFTAVDTEEALSIAKTHPIDFLISDVVLRDVMNGIDLAHKIANENPDIRVSNHQWIHRCKSNWTSKEWRYLEKPFKFDQVFAILVL